MRSHYFSINDHPELLSQLGPQQRVNQIGENTGMIDCPIKWASIAIERCWLYQKELGCGVECKAKARLSQIRAVRKAKKE